MSFLQLKPTDHNAGMAIERIVSREDLCAFICENAQDLLTVQHEAEHLNLCINAIVVNPPCTLQPKQSIEKYRFGIVLFDSLLHKEKDVILHFLCYLFLFLF